MSEKQRRYNLSFQNLIAPFTSEPHRSFLHCSSSSSIDVSAHYCAVSIGIGTVIIELNPRKIPIMKRMSFRSLKDIFRKIRRWCFRWLVFYLISLYPHHRSLIHSRPENEELFTKIARVRSFTPKSYSNQGLRFTKRVIINCKVFDGIKKLCQLQRGI